MLRHVIEVSGNLHWYFLVSVQRFSLGSGVKFIDRDAVRHSRVEQHDLSRPGGDQIRRIWPIFEVFPAARAPAAARDPRNRPTPAPGTRDGRPAPGAGASGARGVPAGRKGPIFSAPGVRVGQQVSEEAPAARAAAPPLAAATGASQMRVFGTQGVHKTRRRRRHCLCRGLDRARDPGS